MKALMLYGKRDMRYLDCETPLPGVGQVRVQVKGTSICGGDLKTYMEGHPIPYSKPHIQGHEISGIVDMLGAGVANVREGTRVAVLPTQSCGTCDNCVSGNINICENRCVTGAVKPNGVREGGMAEYVCVPSRTVIPIPDSVSFQEGALLEIMGIGLHVSRQVGPLHGKTVIIIGAGSVGLSSLVFFRYFGAKKIIVLDLLDARLAYARQWGADHIISAKDDAEQAVWEMTEGINADYVLDAVGSEETLNRALRLCRGGGGVIMAGLEQDRFLFDYRYAVDHEIKLYGSITYTTEMYECLEFLTKGVLSVNHLVTDVVPLSRGAEMFERLATDKSHLVKVMMIP